MSFKKTRIEHDTMGQVNVDNNHLWGAQTQRALEHFYNKSHCHPKAFLIAYLELKKACASANRETDKLTTQQADLITKACNQLLDNFDPSQFPLSIWTSGSGSQTNMNINEVIAHIANKKTSAKPGDKNYIHPNNHVNASQSTNDTYPASIQIATANELVHKLMPTVISCREKMRVLEEKYAHIIKLARTHLQDAVPISTGQVFGCYQELLNDAVSKMHQSLDDLFELPVGGTAVGTGLNAPENFDSLACDQLSEQLKMPFVPAKNKFVGISAHLPMTHASHAITSLATSLNKIANDIRYLSSGPRAGLMEFILPENEPGSSIMPGKVNPTQCEALSMACLKVLANQQLIDMCCASGQFELNTYKPIINYTLLESIDILSGVLDKFNRYCLSGIQINQKVIQNHLDHSYMLITGLQPIIGYDKCAEVVKKAHESGRKPKDICLELGYCDESTYDKHTNPAAMVGNVDDAY